MHRLEQFQSVPGMSLSLQTYNFSHGRFLTLIGSLVDQRFVFLIHIKQDVQFFQTCGFLGQLLLAGKRCSQFGAGIFKLYLGFFQLGPFRVKVS